jgi:hypothetical protein
MSLQIERQRPSLKRKLRPAPPLITRTLNDEALYSDGDPTWVNAPTMGNAKKARKRWIKRLRRFGSEYPEAELLARILRSCKAKRRCMSGACPECIRAFRRWFVSQAQDLVSGAEPNTLHCVSVISGKNRTLADQLTNFSPTNMLRSLTDLARASGNVQWAIGGVDLSLNDDTAKSLDIGWQPQVYAIAHLAEGKSSLDILRKSYQADETVRRPIHIKPYDGSIKAISYAYKADFLRRVAYQREVGPPESRRTCWHTRKVSLRPAEHVQAMLWMHKIGLAGRLFLKGVRMTRNGQNVSLVQIKMKKQE